MLRSLEQLKKALHLSETGQHTAVVDYLRDTAPHEIEKSPMLALTYGTAHARLGRIEEGERWVDIALQGARGQGDHAVELRALNARGAIALAAGRIDEAADYFTRGLEAAKRQGDHTTVGRCSNNLGIIENLRGHYGPAVSSYTLALAAFQQAGFDRGVAEVEHNLGITYRDQRQLGRALEQAGRAVKAADKVGDRALSALTLAVQAEVRALSGDAKLARREIEDALAVHRELEDEPKEIGDLRILAQVMAANSETDEAERLLREVIGRAANLKRPLEGAAAARDLAHVLAKADRPEDARDAAQAARVMYSELGAEGEVRSLDELIGRD